MLLWQGAWIVFLNAAACEWQGHLCYFYGLKDSSPTHLGNIGVGGAVEGKASLPLPCCHMANEVLEQISYVLRVSSFMPPVNMVSLLYCPDELSQVLRLIKGMVSKVVEIQGGGHLFLISTATTQAREVVPAMALPFLQGWLTHASLQGRLY